MRKLTYDLTRSYAAPISLRRTTNSVVDLDAGLNLANLVTITVRKAGILPAQVARQFARAATDVNREQDFSYGGFFDDRTRFFLVSQRDLPSDFPVDKNMHIVFPVNIDGSLTAKSQRYEVASFTDLDMAESLIIQAIATDGAVIDTTAPSPLPPPSPPVPLPNLRKVVAKVADYVVLQNESGTIFTNEGATGPITFTLPVWLRGLNNEFRTVAPFAINVVRHVGDQLQVGGLAGTQASNSTPGGILSVIADAASVWGGTTQGDWDVT